MGGCCSCCGEQIVPESEKAESVDEIGPIETTTFEVPLVEKTVVKRAEFEPPKIAAEYDRDLVPSSVGDPEDNVSDDGGFAEVDALHPPLLDLYTSGLYTLRGGREAAGINLLWHIFSGSPVPCLPGDLTHLTHPHLVQNGRSGTSPSRGALQSQGGVSASTQGGLQGVLSGWQGGGIPGAPGLPGGAVGKSFALGLLEDVARQTKALQEHQRHRQLYDSAGLSMPPGAGGGGSEVAVGAGGWGVGRVQGQGSATGPISSLSTMRVEGGGPRSVRPIAPGDALNAALLLQEHSRFGVPTSAYATHSNPFRGGGSGGGEYGGGDESGSYGTRGFGGPPEPSRMGDSRAGTAATGKPVGSGTWAGMDGAQGGPTTDFVAVGLLYDVSGPRSRVPQGHYV